MKEAYFESETISETATEFLKKVEFLRKRRPLNPSPGKVALLVLDMQKYFLDSSSHAFVPSSPAIIPNIRKLLKKLERTENLFFSRHLNTPENAGNMATWWRELIVAENPMSEISEKFPEKAEKNTIVKSQYDAFHETPLEGILKQSGISQVIITGVMTHICCETTARSAFLKGFQVFFGIDTTATYNRDFHQATLLNLSHGFATPFLVQEMLSKLP